MKMKSSKLMAVAIVALMLSGAIVGMIASSDESDAESVTGKVGSYLNYNTLWVQDDIGEVTPSGSLPPGVIYDKDTGYIKGTPTQAGSWVFKLDIETWVHEFYETTYYITISSTPTVTYSYSVKYYGNGGTDVPPDYSTTSSSTSISYKIPATVPTRAGYTFIGYSSAADTSWAYSAGQTITIVSGSPARSMYAQWEIASSSTYTHTLHYDANGGSGAPPDQTLTDNLESTMMILSPIIPVRSGYIFAGWGMTTDEQHPSPGGDHMSVGAERTMYAIWVQTEYTFTFNFDANGGSGAPPSVTKTRTLDWTYFSPDGTEPVRYGFKFLGWASSATATSPDYPEDGKFIATSPNVTFTFYAVWEMDESIPVQKPIASFYYSVNGLTVTFTDTSIAPNVWQWAFGDTSIATSQNPIHEYSKSGTYTVTLSVTNETQEVSAYSQVITVGGAVDAEYTVTFDTAGGDAVNPVTVKSGSGVELPSCSKTGHVFGGWYYGAVLVGNAGSDYTVNGDVVLTAAWLPMGTVTHVITFVDGDKTTVQIVPDGGRATYFSGTGENFKEWQLDGKPYQFAAPVKSAMTLTAVYDESSSSHIMSIVIGIAGALAVAVFAATRDPYIGLVGAILAVAAIGVWFL